MGTEFGKREGNAFRSVVDVNLAQAVLGSAERVLVAAEPGSLLAMVFGQAAPLTAVSLEAQKDTPGENLNARLALNMAAHHSTRAALYASLGNRADALREVQSSALHFDRALLALTEDGGAR